MESVTTDGRDEGCRPPTRSWASKTGWSYDDLHGMVNRFEDTSLYISVLEGSVLISDTVRIGLEGRDEGIRVFKQFLRACGRVGIPTFCYGWMAASAGLALKSRSKARRLNVHQFDDAEMPDEPKAVEGVAREQFWEALEYFLREIDPAAEGADVKLGLHPDDPPHESVRGIPRNINSLDA